MDCGRVTPNLFVGSFPLDRNQIDGLKSLGITAILSFHLRPPGSLRSRALLPCGMTHPPRWLGHLGSLHLSPRPALLQ